MGGWKKDPMVIHYQLERSAAYLLSNGRSVGREVKKAGGRMQRQPQTENKWGRNVLKGPNFNPYLPWDRIAAYL